MPTENELHEQLDEFFKQAMEWKRRAINAENAYNYWRNRAERAEQELGRVPIIPDAESLRLIEAYQPKLGD